MKVVHLTVNQKVKFQLLPPEPFFGEYMEITCTCICHTSLLEGGWSSIECCPDCGSSLTSDVVD